MYLMGSDEYECDICGFREKWDAHDDHRGDMWECERCGKHFCTNCIKKACGEEDFRKMLSETDNVLCPECWKNQPQKKKFSINIRETLETQVTVEAENKEDALREAEKRWKNGEYILDADNFQGADFWEDKTGDEFGELRRAWQDGLPPQARGRSMSDCVNKKSCIDYARLGENAECYLCPDYKAPMTNADRIRAMSDEDLAILLSRCFVNCIAGPCTLHDNSHSRGCITEWLRQPAEEEA